jgi:hypothetical protein
VIIRTVAGAGTAADPGMAAITAKKTTATTTRRMTTRIDILESPVSLAWTGDRCCYSASQ